MLDVFAKPPTRRGLDIFESSEPVPPATPPTPISKDVQELSKVEIQKKDKLVSIENVADFSDPLRAENLSPGKFEAPSVELEVQRPFDNRFRTALSSTILSISPCVSFPLPFFETEAGKKCSLRSHFPDELYYSKHWSSKAEKPEVAEVSSATTKDQCDESKFTNDFLVMKITEPADHPDIQTALADYRRSGGCYKKVTRMKKLEKKPSNVRLNSSLDALKDVLDVHVHQRLPVLFCSYYYNTRELPTSFCAQPLMLDMHFYGQDDIMLGLFLQRYCFRSSYICPSCKLPMMSHVRKYAHSMGVVTVKLAEDPIKNDSASIHMTSRCTICNTMVSLLFLQ